MATVTAYLRFVQDLAHRGRAAGLSPLQAAREADLGAFADLLDSERIVRTCTAHTPNSTAANQERPWACQP